MLWLKGWIKKIVGKDPLHFPEVKCTFQIVGNFPSSTHAFPNQTRQTTEDCPLSSCWEDHRWGCSLWSQPSTMVHTPPPTSSNIPLYLKGIHCTNFFFKFCSCYFFLFTLMVIIVFYVWDVVKKKARRLTYWFKIDIWKGIAAGVLNQTAWITSHCLKLGFVVGF